MTKRNDIRIIFRADGNSSIGLGHIYRSLALVEMLKDMFDCLFLINRPIPKVQDLIEAACPMIALDSSSQIEEMGEIKPILHATDIVVLDGYHFEMGYQKFMKSHAKKLVMMDDKADQHYFADIVINQGSPSIESKYRTENYTRLLVGIRYLLVRRDFLEAARIPKEISKVESVFISMGGADPFNVTTKVLRACLGCGFIKNIFVVTGSAYNHNAQLSQIIEEAPASKEILHAENIPASELISFINKSQLAICPASSISLEVCCVKAGLLTGTVIDNQDHILNQLVQLGCCISLGNFNDVSAEDIQIYLEKANNVDLVNSMMQKQRDAIDGLSGRRILNEFIALADA